MEEIKDEVLEVTGTEMPEELEAIGTEEKIEEVEE